MHSLTYCCPRLAPAMVTVLAAAVQVNQSVLALQATMGRYCCQVPQIKGFLLADESGQCFGVYFGPVLRNLDCSGLEGVSSDQAVSSCPCVLFPKPVALLLARSNQTQQRQKFHHKQLQIRGKILLMLLLRQSLQNELIICNSRKSSQENGSGNIPICLFIKTCSVSQTPEGPARRHKAPDCISSNADKTFSLSLAFGIPYLSPANALFFKIWFLSHVLESWG